MKTAKQIKKEARERYDKKFEVYYYPDPTEKPVARNPEYLSPDIVFDFIDQLIDTTIKQVLEGVRKKMRFDLEESIYVISCKDFDKLFNQTSKGD